MPKYSIVIPTKGHLSDCLIPLCESIKKNTDLSDCEVIVVDNGSEGDGTDKYVDSLGSPFRLLYFPRAIGFTHAANVGIDIAKGEYIVLLNNDLQLLANNWLQMLYTPFEKSEKTGVTGAAKNWHKPTNGEFVLFFCVMVKKSLFEELKIYEEI